MADEPANEQAAETARDTALRELFRKALKGRSMLPAAYPAAEERKKSPGDDSLKRAENLQLMGGPVSVGKTYMAKKIAEMLMNRKDDDVQIVDLGEFNSAAMENKGLNIFGDLSGATAAASRRQGGKLADAFVNGTPEAGTRMKPLRMKGRSSGAAFASL